MELSEFRDIGQKKRGKKQMKVTHSFGVYDCYKLIRRNKWFDIGRPLKEKEFYAIVRGINSLLAEDIAKGNSVKFPEKMGMLELRRFNAGVSIVDDRLRNTYPVDWSATWELWFNDKEAYQRKILVRNEQKQVFYVRYCKYNATYDNKIFYLFVLNRNIKSALKDNIKKRIVDTLW